MAENEIEDAGYDLETVLETVSEQKGEFEDPRMALASGCLVRSIGARGCARIRAARHGVVLLSVLPSWETWVGKAVIELFPGRHLFFPKFNRKGQQDAGDKKRLAEMVAKRKSVVAILPEGGGFPENMNHLVDLRFSVTAPNLQILREVARRCLTGNARRIVFMPAETDLDALSACFSPGSPVSAAVAKLDRLRVKRSDDNRSVPPLSAIYGLDAAKAWGADLKTDLDAYRAGRLPYSAVDAGAVLAGPPGTGKTMVARIIAAECRLNFVPTSIGELFATSDGDLGAVIRRSRQVFSEARSSAPSLLFIDELDALPSRSTLDARGKDWWTPVITEFLTQLDSSLSDREGLVVLGATNRYADLDPALIRPGRLSRLLLIEPPSADDLAGIFRHHLGADLLDADLSTLASEVVGASGAQLADWVNAARRAARNAGRPIEARDLWNAAIGPETRSAARLRRTAIHEAGHCVVGHHVAYTPEYVTIRRQGNRDGATTLTPSEPPTTFADVERLVTMLLGGMAAESVILGVETRSLGAGGAKGSDLHLATELIAAGYISHGAGSTIVWRAAPDEALNTLSADPALRRRVEHELRRLLARAEDIVRADRGRCEKLADHLLRKMSLTRIALAGILKDQARE